MLKLKEGSNLIIVEIENEYGNDKDQITVQYKKPVLKPTVSFVIPNSSPVTVSAASKEILAKTAHIQDKRQVNFTLNGNQVSTFNFDAKKGEIKANLTLRRGSNTAKISVSNESGEAIAEQIIIYKIDKPDTGQKPSVEFVSSSSPVADPFNPTQAISKIVVNTKGVINKDEIKIKVGTILVEGFTFEANTGVIKANVPLKPGENLIVVTVTNRYGMDQASNTVTF